MSPDTPPPTRSILEMSADEARGFLLKPVSYCSIDIPDYIDFTQVLTETAKVLESARLSGMQGHSPRDESGVNYTLLANKDGRYAWRPFQVIHPALYVSLVETLTAEDAWKAITDRFTAFSTHPRVDCLSIPLESQTKRSDQAEQVTQWWQGIEQRSIELSLEYQYVLHADISDCYGSIYTHSIPWALHTRPIAKAPR